MKQTKNKYRPRRKKRAGGGTQKCLTPPLALAFAGSLSLRVDYDFGKQTSGFIMSVGEAF
jgi:hypothetical protein